MHDGFSLVIFTPTYNRAHTLPRCYNSIISQNYKNLTWLVIDDGSQDDTKNFINNCKNENKINIIYIYQENSGKQAAWNEAVKRSQEFSLFLGLDSDDILRNNCLEEISKYFNYLHEPDIIGLRCIAMRESTQAADSNFSKGVIQKNSWFNEIASNKIGERIDIFNPKILLNFLYPVHKGVKFIPEMWFYSTISAKYKFIYVPEVLTIFYDQHNHFRLSQAGVKKHAEGQKIARGTFLKEAPLMLWFKNPIFMLKNSIRYFQSCYYAKKLES